MLTAIDTRIDELIPYENNVIVAGHTRLKAAKLLGLKKVPVIKADDLTDEQVRAFRLADNKTAELAGWDYQLLSQELAEIHSMNMSDFGFEQSGRLFLCLRGGGWDGSGTDQRDFGNQREF